MERLKSIWKNIVSSGFQLVAIYFIFKFRWGQESWFKDKVSDALSLILMYSAIFIVSILMLLITPPVTIELKLPNKHYPEANETRFSIRRGKPSMEHERTVALRVKVKRRYSAWGRIVAWVIKSFHVKVLIEPLTDGIIIQAVAGQMRRDITETQTGFVINIDEYLSRIMSKSTSGESEKECGFIIVEDTLHRVTDEIIQITPLLLKRGQAAPGILSLILDFKHDSHIVHFKRE